eukprot:610970-Prorocentrum_minimum.AAC.1
MWTLGTPMWTLGDTNVDVRGTNMDVRGTNVDVRGTKGGARTWWDRHVGALSRIRVLGGHRGGLLHPHGEGVEHAVPRFARAALRVAWRVAFAVLRGVQLVEHKARVPQGQVPARIEHAIGPRQEGGFIVRRLDSSSGGWIHRQEGGFVVRR